MPRKTKDGAAATPAEIPSAGITAKPDPQTAPAAASAAEPKSESPPSPEPGFNIGEIIERSMIEHGAAAQAKAPADPQPKPPAPKVKAQDPDPEEEGEDAAVPDEAEDDAPGEEPLPEADSEADANETSTEEGRRDGKKIRFDKLTARNTELKEKLARAEAELESLKTAKPEEAQRSEEPAQASEVPQELRGLSTQIKQVEEVLQWTEANPDGGEVPDGKGGSQVYDAAQVRQVRARVLAQHNKLSAEYAVKAAEIQREYRASCERYNKEAGQQFPWMANKKSAEFQEALAIARANPAILRAPDHAILLGQIIEGRKAIAAAKAKKAAVLQPAPEEGPARRVAPRVPMPGQNPGASRAVESPVAKSLKRIQSGDEKAVAEYMAARLVAA